MPKARSTPTTELRIGTAGWTLPKQHAHHFPEAAPSSASAEKLSHLQRCAARLNCVEINSSFHRPHQRKTWERWGASTPQEFRFAVKVPKTVTHAAKLVNTGSLLAEFLEGARGLGTKLGPLLVQLPPSLAFDEGVAHEFLTTLRELHPHDAVAPGANPVVLEPRHPTWFTPAAGRLLRNFAVARVAADPAKGSPLAAEPSGWAGLRYWRLHGSPRTYYSEYSSEFLTRFAANIQAAKTAETWVIFDNTALGHATGNALQLRTLLRSPGAGTSDGSC